MTQGPMDIGTGLEYDPLRIGAEYLRSMNPDVLRSYDTLGLAPEFTAIMAKHLNDIDIVIPRVGEHDRGTAYLDVKKINFDGVPQWRRVAVMSGQQLSTYSQTLETVLKSQEITEDINGERIDVDALALDWIFFELTADVAANSYTMQQMYDGYIRDWNGQAHCYKAQYSFSRELFNEYAAVSESNEQSIASDHLSFIGGIGLILLKEDLLARKVTDSVARASWITEGIRKNYPTARNGTYRAIMPLDKQDIIQRFVGFKPRLNVRERMQEFARLFIDELIVGDED